MSGEFSTRVANWRSRRVSAALAAASVAWVSMRSSMLRITASVPSGRCSASFNVEIVDSTWISWPPARTCTDSERQLPSVRSSSRARSARPASDQRSRYRSPRGRPSISEATQPYWRSAAGFM